MKKVTALLTLFALILSLSSCGNSNDEKVICKNCGLESVADAKFCSACGISLDEIVSNSNNNEFTTTSSGLNDTNDNDDGTTQISSGNNSTDNNSSKFSLSSNLDNCIIEGNEISITVSNGTNSLSFINAFSIPKNYKWELHYDKECLPNLNIVGKSVDLDYGTNILYALFTNKNNSDEIYLYEVNVYLICPSAVGTYYNSSGYILNIYENGTLYLSYNGEYMDMEGTWTQLENTICYSVWNIDGFEWNNPFYDAIYDNGIDFLGEYYTRID